MSTVAGQIQRQDEPSLISVAGTVTPLFLAKFKSLEQNPKPKLAALNTMDDNKYGH